MNLTFWIAMIIVTALLFGMYIFIHFIVNDIAEKLNSFLNKLDGIGGGKW